ncbi:hypothetical protein PCIT_a3050 [Pseudoalteromonas citrea]|uniref:Uncharacterized protein n=3 Tax=Pseudoalteromonas TaxID=53246 RepID=A0A5S3V252_9GAMM|nr:MULTISPECIES: hypothetical protein [Pseudoalteromonas]KAF7770093.1 hypothetical protein PCIT_a3050 [Pseudoalteromonas citrea]TMO64429.1 hypothetical protein CWC19_18330 [Pseudoalteromonas aurantia]
MTSRNQKYEKQRKEKGQKKITVWVPEQAEIEVKQMCEFLCENPDYIPFMARSLTTGKMKKAI